MTVFLTENDNDMENSAETRGFLGLLEASTRLFLGIRLQSLNLCVAGSPVTRTMLEPGWTVGPGPKVELRALIGVVVTSNSVLNDWIPPGPLIPMSD